MLEGEAVLHIEILHYKSSYSMKMFTRALRIKSKSCLIQTMTAIAQLLLLKCKFVVRSHF